MRKPFFLILAFLLILGLHNFTFAAPRVFDTEGIFIMGDNDTRAQAKDFALQDAKRLALEQAGTYLQSITQVTNGQVTKDEIISISSGVIKLECILSENTKLEGNFITLIIKARFVIDSDDLQKKIDNLRQSEKRQEEIQQMADLKSRYDTLLAENNSLKTQLAQTTDQKAKEQLLSKTQEVYNQLAATQCVDKGNEFIWRQDYDNAIAVFSQAITLDSQYAGAYYNRGNAYYQKGLYDFAIADFNHAIDINPQSDSAYNNRGNAYAGKGLHDLAIADFSHAIGINPQESLFYYNRGNSYYQKGLYDLAIADFDRTITISPHYANAYYNRGNVYYKKELYDLAIADYSRIISINPQYDLAYYNRGSAYFKKRLYDLAIADFDRTTDINPQYVPAYFNKALSCEILNRPREAAESYRKFLQYAPAGHPQIPYAKQRLAALGG